MWRDFGIFTLAVHSDEVKVEHQGKQYLDILIGPACSGKSTYASTHYKPHEIISSDKIREENGWGFDPIGQAKTFRFAHDLIKARLKNGLRTVFDATNLKAKDRLKVVDCLPNGQYCRYIVLNRDYTDKIANRGNRTEELILDHDLLFKKEIKSILSADEKPNVVVLDIRSYK
jgi:hypothetical protein